MATPRSLAVLRTATRATSSRSPVRASMASASVSRSWTRAPPTLPHPRTPTFTGFTRLSLEIEAGEILDCFAADDGAPASVLHKHDRRTGNLVVVGRHAVAVGAGYGGGQDVAHLQVGRQLCVPDDQVARLAVVADDVD